MINSVFGSLYPEVHDPANPNSVPDYDSWGPDLTMWNCKDWTIWHGALKKKLGKPHADKMWVEAWQAQSIGAEPIDCRSFDDSFREWAKNENLLDSLYWGLGKVIAKPIGTGRDIGTNIAKSTSWAIPLMAIMAMGYFLVMYAPKPRR